MSCHLFLDNCSWNLWPLDFRKVSYLKWGFLFQKIFYSLQIVLNMLLHSEKSWKCSLSILNVNSCCNIIFSCCNISQCISSFKWMFPAVNFTFGKENLYFFRFCEIFSFWVSIGFCLETFPSKENEMLKFWNRVSWSFEIVQIKLVSSDWVSIGKRFYMTFWRVGIWKSNYLCWRGYFRVEPFEFWLKGQIGRVKRLWPFCGSEKAEKNLCFSGCFKKKDGNLRHPESREMSGWWQCAWLCLFSFSFDMFFLKIRVWIWLIWMYSKGIREVFLWSKTL
jgi:hypothetical protein